MKMYCLVLPLSLMLVLIGGCDNLGRSLGTFPVSGRIAENDLGPDSRPLASFLYVPDVSEDGQPECCAKKPLVRVAYRSPWTGRIVNRPDESHDDHQSYYMVIDVGNMVRTPNLGVADPAGAGADEYKKRLHAIAEMLVTAADWNGEVYWRHFTTFMSYQSAAQTASRSLVAGGIAASFLSPVLGASLAGAGLAFDVGLRDLTEGFNIHQYKEIRDAASTYRQAVREKVWVAVDSGYSAHATSDLLRLADDYAFTYSITGAIQGATKQNAELRNLLLTGDSEWKALFEPVRNQLRTHGAQSAETAANAEKKAADATTSAAQAKQRANIAEKEAADTKK